MSEDKFRVRQIPPELVGRFWPYAEPYIKRALDHTSGEFTAKDIQHYADGGFIQLWLVSEGSRIVAAVTTEVVVYPQRKHLRVITLAGSKAPEWTGQVVTILNDYAKVQGCAALEAFVRKGYVPVLAKYGYKFKYSAVIRELE